MRVGALARCLDDRLCGALLDAAAFALADLPKGGAAPPSVESRGAC